VLEEAEDENNPELERLKFLAISASNLDEFFEIRVAAMVQQIEDGYNEAGPDGLTLVERRDTLARLTHEFVDDQYECWNSRLRPALAENGIHVLSLHELDPPAQRFVEQLRKRARPITHAGDRGPGSPVSAGHQQGIVPGFALAPPPALRARLYGRGSRASGFAQTGAVTLRGQLGFHFPR
jgi:hypothetical protein